MYINRRNFIKLCTGTIAGLGVSQIFHPAVAKVLASSLTGQRAPVLWIQGQSCTGCSVTLLNSAHPKIATILLDIISLDFHPTLMASEGEQAMHVLRQVAMQKQGQFFLVLEGAIPVAEEGRYCVVGEADGEELTLTDILYELAPQAAAALAVGTCATYGGIPAAQGSQTGAMGLGAFLQQHTIATPVINIPGCPPHPDWIVGTLSLALMLTHEQGLHEGLAAVMDMLDSQGRPMSFYSQNVHDNCPYLAQFDAARITTSFMQKDACRYDLGCKGPRAYCDSFSRKWNGGVNWCVDNAVCIGCTEPNFPDGQSPFYSNE